MPFARMRLRGFSTAIDADCASRRRKIGGGKIARANLAGGEGKNFPSPNVDGGAHLKTNRAERIFERGRTD